MKKCKNKNKLPKYSEGSGEVQPNFWNDNGTNIINAVGTGANIAARNIGRPVTASGVVSGVAQGASAGAAFGPWGAAIGGATGGILAGIGTGGSVDVNTGEITNPSGIAGWFGHSKTYLQNRSNLLRSNLNARTLTNHLMAEYYSNPNILQQPNTFAEGGIVRKPVKARVSRGELIYDPETKALSKIPGDDGKPNKKDDIITTLREGDMIINNNSDMLMSNGKTAALNLKKLVNTKGSPSEGTKMARDRIIKKVINWQEALKNESTLGAYATGTDNIREGKQQLAKEIAARKAKRAFENEDYFIFRGNDGKFYTQDINGNKLELPEFLYSYIDGNDEDGYSILPLAGVAPSPGKWNGSMNYAKAMKNKGMINRFKTTMKLVFAPNKKLANPTNSALNVQKVKEQVKAEDNLRRGIGWGEEYNRQMKLPAAYLALLEGRGTVPFVTKGLGTLDSELEDMYQMYRLKQILPTAAAVAGIGGLGAMSLFGPGSDLSYTATPEEQAARLKALVSSESTTNAQFNAVDKNGNVIPPAITKPVEQPVNAEAEINPEVAAKTATTVKPVAKAKAVGTKIAGRKAKAVQTQVPVKPLVYPHADDLATYNALSQSIPYPDKIELPDYRPIPSKWDVFKHRLKNFDYGKLADAAYPLASVLTPLLDKAKPESVNYTLPQVKYENTSYDISDINRLVNQDYATSIYNMSKINPNTGAGMGYGIQAATNAMKQHSDNYLTQARMVDSAIARNNNIYNDWSGRSTAIMNNAYDQYAANKASARNINRAGVANSLNNYGKYLKDMKMYDMDKYRMEIMKPFINYGFENADKILSSYA